MPVYEYRCEDCNRRFEKRRSYSESDALADCPACEGRRTHRLISSFMAFTSSSNGEAQAVAGGGGCAGCAGGSCAGCGR